MLEKAKADWEYQSRTAFYTIRTAWGLRAMYTDPNSISLLGKEGILSLQTPDVPDNEKGIYFLLKGEEILYIGMSESSIEYRIHCHFGRLPLGAFDRFASIPPPHWNIPLAEALYIHEYRPRLNIKYPYINDLTWREKPYSAMSEEERCAYDERQSSMGVTGCDLTKEELRARIMEYQKNSKDKRGRKLKYPRT